MIRDTVTLRPPRPITLYGERLLNGDAPMKGTCAWKTCLWAVDGPSVSGALVTAVARRAAGRRAADFEPTHRRQPAVVFSTRKRAARRHANPCRVKGSVGQKALGAPIVDLHYYDY